MEFDPYTIALLMLRPDAPVFSEQEEAELQDAHMSHLAQLHEAGQLLTAGPVLGAPDRALRGFSILNVDPGRARQLKEEDPAVRAGKYRVEIYPWLLPAGLMAFSTGRLPRSVAGSGRNSLTDVRDRIAHSERAWRNTTAITRNRIAALTQRPA